MKSIFWIVIILASLTFMLNVLWVKDLTTAFVITTILLLIIYRIYSMVEEVINNKNIAKKNRSRYSNKKP